MDMGKFVAEVRKRECLWNRIKIPQSVDQRQICEKQWEEVGKICKIPKETAKVKWRSLRDHFYKLLKRVPVYTTGGTYYIEENEKPNWTHFNNLMFLLATYKPKQKVINIRDESIVDIQAYSDSDSCTADDEETRIETVPPLRISLRKKNTPPSARNTGPPSIAVDEDTEIDIGEAEVKEEPEIDCEEQEIDCEKTCESPVDILPPLAMVRPQLPVPAFTSIKRVYTLVDTDDLNVTSTPPQDQNRSSSKRIALESNVNTNVLRESDNCSDANENMAFFRSLLPFMKKLDPIQQLRVRMRCQESLLEEMGALNN